MKNKEKKDILQEQEIIKDLTCKDENKVQNNVHIEKEKNDTKNINGLNKKKDISNKFINYSFFNNFSFNIYCTNKI